MNPRRILEVAVHLAGKQGSAEYRSAVSRAYYAVFNVAVDFLEKLGFPKAGKEYHVALQRKLLNCADPEFEQIGSTLGDFHAQRVLADYFMSDPSTEQEEAALAAIREAERIIQAFDQLPINSERWKNIKAAIARVNYG